MPETDIKKLKTLKCDVLGIFAKKDQHITPKVVTDFQKNMKEAGKTLDGENFRCRTCFCQPSNPAYNNKFAAQADKMAMDYLKKKFNPANKIPIEPSAYSGRKIYFNS